MHEFHWKYLPIQQSTKIIIYNCLLDILGHVAATREQLLLQTQKLASRRSEKPPKLPPRDNIYHPHDIPKPDYDDINEDDRLKAFRVKSDKGRDLNKKYGTLIQIYRCICTISNCHLNNHWCG